jgi:hypothetical protein
MCGGSCDGMGACDDPCASCPYGEADCDGDGSCESSCNDFSGPCDYVPITCRGSTGGYDCDYPNRQFVPAGERCRGMPGVCDGMGMCRII